MVIIIGRLANDPKLNSDKTARFTIVSNDVEGNARFTPCIVPSKQAELVMRYMKRGMLTYLEGNWASLERQTLIAKKITFVSPVSKGDLKMVSKLERARLALKERKLQGMQAFNCEALCDPRETVYQDGEIAIKVCYSWGYVDILGLDDSDFKKLTTLRNGHRFIKKGI